VVQVSTAQSVISVHAPQMRFAVALHAVVSYIPAAHWSVEHGSHAVPLQNKPASQALHTASVVFVQLTDEQPAITAQVVHARSASVEHATDSNWPETQLAAHGSHALPLAK
jgi:hypothetical protein